MKLDLVLVNPGSRISVYQSLGRTLAAIEPPVWAGLIATFVRRRGASVAIVDANAEDLSPEETAERVAELDPRLVAVVVYGHNPSASTQVMPSAGAICTALRRRVPTLPSVLVGGHVAALPERTLREEDATFVADGEGLYTIQDLIEAVRAGDTAWEKVRGLRYREDGAIRATAPAPLVRDLDGEMPGIAWDLLPMERYRAHNWHCFGEPDRTPYAAIYTTLGCPHRCTFCCIQAPFKRGEQALGMPATVNSYRAWSPEVVLREIDTLVSRYGVRHLKIADEMFVLNPRHVLGISEGIVARGHDLNMWSYARVDSVREPMLETLRRAGMRWLAFGIEAGSERVRDDVRKGFTAEMLGRTLAGVASAGIHVLGNYIFGLPEDDDETMRATLALALELNAEYANFYCAMAYPGSALYLEALERGWPLPEQWSGYSQHAVDTLPLPTRWLPASEVLRFRDRAFDTYFTSPGYLETMRRTFGDRAVEQVSAMTEHTLVRRYA